VTRNSRNTLLTVEAPATDCVDVRNAVNRVQPMHNAAAKRMRRYRQRRRSGLRCLTVLLRETEIDMLICRALLEPKMRNDKSAIIRALHDYFDQTLGMPR
jgi:hypothetical protein